MEPGNSSPARPALLTILCILSLIAAGVGIVWYGMIVLAAMSSEDTTYGILGMVSAVIGVAGIIMMWKMKKTGFYVYTASVLLSTINDGMSEEGISYLWLGIGVVFIALYALHLKTMK